MSVYIRVDRTGGATAWELMIDGRRVRTLDYGQVCDLIDATNAALRELDGDHIGLVEVEGESVTFIEAINLQMQATSSLRWKHPKA